MDTVDNTVRCLHSASIRIGREIDMQIDVFDALISAGAAFGREVQLSNGDRIDFVVDGGIGIECKVSGSTGSVHEQLVRYAACHEINALILVTAKGRHAIRSASILGKPCRTVWVAPNAAL